MSLHISQKHTLQYIQQTVSQRGSIDTQSIHLAEFTKRQQIEYAEALAELKAKISTTENTIANMETINAGLAADIADCRMHNERFAQEMGRKDDEIQKLRMARGHSQPHLVSTLRYAYIVAVYILVLIALACCLLH